MLAYHSNPILEKLVVTRVVSCRLIEVNSRPFFSLPLPILFPNIVLLLDTIVRLFDLRFAREQLQPLKEILSPELSPIEDCVSGVHWNNRGTEVSYFVQLYFLPLLDCSICRLLCLCLVALFTFTQLSPMTLEC